MKKVFIILFFSLFFEFLFAATYYPELADDLPIEINFTTQVLNEGDRVGSYGSTAYGLFWAAGGIDIQKNASSGTAYFSSPLFVDKELNLDEDVTVVLYSSLCLANGAYLASSGVFSLLSRTIVLSGVFGLEDNILTFITYNAKINGNGNIVDFSKGGKIVFNYNSSSNDLYIDNCYLKGLQEDSILFTNIDRSLFLTNCILQLDDDFCVNFNIDVSGEVLVTGTHTFCINHQLVINDGACMIMDVGTTFSMGYYGDLDVATNGSLHFNGCNIEIGDNFGQADDINNGLFLRLGSIIFENEVHINDDGKRKFFQIADDASVTLLSGARVILDGTTTFSIGGTY